MNPRCLRHRRPYCRSAFPATGVRYIRSRLAGRRLERPQEKGRKPRILLQRSGQTVSCLRFRGAKDLLQSCTTDHFPYLLEVLGQTYLAPLRGLHETISAEYFQGGTDTGEYQIRAADAFRLQTFHPVGDAARKFIEYVRPVADRSVVRARATDEVDARGEGGGIAGAKTRFHFGGNWPRSRDRPTATGHTRKQCLPTFRGLVGENDGADAFLR